MSTDRQRARCQERLRRMAGSRLDSRQLREEAMAELDRTIGFDAWSWSLTDPDSLISWSAVLSATAARLSPQQPGAQLAIEQRAAAAMRDDLMRAERPVATLSGATDSYRAGQRDVTERLRPHALGDVLVWACRDSLGCWGWMKAVRAADRGAFGDEDVALLASLTDCFGSALRVGAGRGSAPAAVGRPPGVLVLDGSLRTVSWTPSAPDWLAELPGGTDSPTALPPGVIYAVAGRAADPRPTATSAAYVRVRTTAGTWAAIDAAPLEGDGRGQVAVTIRAAEAADIADLLARIYELTPRERQLATLAANGLRTREIATLLHLSPYTVKDHFKSIFAKTGVHTRRELAVALAGGAPPANSGSAVPASPRLRPPAEPPVPHPPEIAGP